MLQDLLLMCAAPTMIVAGAPWQPLLDGLPGRAGRSATAEVLRGGCSRPLRTAAGWLLRPWVAVAAFNVVMLAWHDPALLRLAQSTPAAPLGLLVRDFC